MSWFLLKDSELFILFAENSQTLLKIFVIPILLCFIYLVAFNLLVNNQLNSSLRHIIVTLYVLSDNSGIPPAISSIPVLQRLMKFKIGSTRVSIQATDVSGNVGKCTFSITVKGM